ncbi:MAG: hypothetical protein PVJ92_01180 [Candidatus Dependentiae bacterium]
MVTALLISFFLVSNCAAYLLPSDQPKQEALSQDGCVNNELVEEILCLFERFFSLSREIDDYTPKVFMDSFRNSYNADELCQLVECLLTEVSHLESIIKKYHPKLTSEYASLEKEIAALKEKIEDESSSA